MKLHFGACLALVALLFAAADGSSANALKGGAPVGRSAPGSSATVGSYSTVSGVVTAIDAQGGTLVLDGQRRYEFAASTLTVRRQTDTRRPAGVADIKPGERVSLSVVSKGTNAVARISEVWIAR